MGSILDDGDVPLGQLGGDRGEVNGSPAVQDGHDSTSGRGDGLQHVGAGDAEGGRANVGEAGPSAAGEDGLDAGAKGQGGDDDLIARADPGGEQCDMQRGGSGGDRDDVRDAEERGDLVLEQFGFPAVGVVAAAQDAGDLGGLVPVQVGQGVAAHGELAGLE